MFKIKYSYDLHIHSVLSPCADELMTPNNILNMSMLQKLDFISITDHNSTKQLKVIRELEESYDFVIIPGVEVSVLEKFDVLCYFRTFEDAYKIDSFLEANLGTNWNNFEESDQVITDIYDTQLETFSKPLTSTTISYHDLVKEVRKYNGAIVLAHIDRGSVSALNSFDLKEIEFDAIEVQPYRREEYLSKHPELSKYHVFHNSDSHSLLSIAEPEFFMDLEEKTIDSFFKFVMGEKNE